jgi:hypothetical protein
MAEIPIPTAAEVGQGASWFASQAGIVALVEAVFIAVLIAAVVGAVRYFGGQTKDAWVRVTQISEARTADARAGDEAINKNTLALTIVAERLNNRNG